ncbi:MAG: hypothetical protein EA352_06775 [Gemmatimonadales bacterium]|nr:MAG: hypothetical protein EA352_06775 [Gemmatimonadales bacterium]
MMRLTTAPLALAAAGLLLLAPGPEVEAQQLPQTGAERANWERTTTHQEVLDFIYEVQALTDRMMIEELTVTNQGRSLPVVYLGDPPLSDPGSSLLSGKPTVFIINTIHGNERSGKEGGQQFIRELVLGDWQHLLEDVNVIVVPHMNPDGGDAGRRQNSLGYDMNRDWVVMETPEVTAVTEQILTRFWPDVFVDAHNGGSYPYHMTYQTTLDPTADQEMVEFARGPMYEHIKAHLEARDMKFFWYSGPSFDSDQDMWYWRTTIPWVRKQHSYGGFQNMITLLYEVPGRHSLEVGADAARESMLALVEFVAENADEVRQVVTNARRRTVEDLPTEIILDTEETAYDELVEFYIQRRDDDGNWMEPELVEGENRTLWAATETRTTPEWGYAFDGRLDDVAAFLRRHGIQVEQLREETTVPVERFRIEEISWASQPYQNHLLASVDVELVPDEMTFPEGTYMVRLRQHAGRLIPQFLEPDGEDSVLRWNFLDHSIPRQGGENAFVPIYRMQAPPAAAMNVVR